MAEQDFPEEREAPEADAAEQAHALEEDGETTPRDPAFGQPLPLEVDPADAVEQAVPVPVDEDEYR
jgi:hypothetical protein